MNITTVFANVAVSPLDPPKILSLRGELDLIRAKFALWNDPFSQKIHKWCRKALEGQPTEVQVGGKRALK